MKRLFPGYYRPTPGEFETLWRDCEFALDANVLLNLYRYPKQARDELLNILGDLQDRLWLPFQAALEFQRNRASVVADQKRRFREVRSVVSKARDGLEGGLERLQVVKRHSTIDPYDLIEGVQASVEAFEQELDKLEAEQPSVEEEDPLRTQIDNLFEGRVGDPPESQRWLDDLYERAKERYSAEIPPGYSDQGKESDSPNTYTWGGLVYEAHFGDLVIWQQLIERARSADVKSLIFLTDDDKSDWWWFVESEGKKKLGPRPELVDEILRESEIEQFYMYSSLQFLTFSREYLAARVTQESIEQVKEVERASSFSRTKSALQAAMDAEKAVAEWFQTQYPEADVRRVLGYPDITVSKDDTEIGVSVTYASTARSLPDRLHDHGRRGYIAVLEGKFSEFEMVVVLRDPKDLSALLELVDRGLVKTGEGVGLIVGEVLRDSNAKGGLSFEVLHRVPPA